MTFIKGQIPWNKSKSYHNSNRGRNLSLKHKEALRVPRKGAGIYKRTVYHKEITRKGLKRFYENGGKLGFRVKKYFNIGEKNVNWKGGVTSINEKIRKSVEYRLWREAVFARDNWVCVECGKRGGELRADHIKMFAFHPELRFAIDNGRTLCFVCNRKLPTSKSKKHICCL